MVAQKLAKDAVKYLSHMKTKAEERMDGKRLLMQEKSLHLTGQTMGKI